MYLFLLSEIQQPSVRVVTLCVTGEKNCEDMRAHANLGISGSWVEYLCFSGSLSITGSGCVWNGSDWCSPDTEAELERQELSCQMKQCIVSLGASRVRQNLRLRVGRMYFIH